MAEKKEYKVQAKLRDGSRKKRCAARARDGMVPITVYGGGAETVAAVAPLVIWLQSFVLKPDEIRFSRSTSKAWRSEVMFHDRQIDPVKGRLIHADLTRWLRDRRLK
jgi:ribosomal protein L25 (general stress protein Ctc)